MLLYSTNENHPWTFEQAYRNLNESSSLVVAGLIWAVNQDDETLQLLALKLLQNHYLDAKLALPAARLCVRSEDRLVRVTAIHTCAVMNDTSEELIPLRTSKLKSDDDFERTVSAGTLFKISRSEDAYTVLRRELAAGDSKPTALMALGYLEDTQ